MDEETGSGPTGIGFDAILRSEIEAINRRRAALGRDLLPTDIGSDDDRKVIEAVGLALSGGGIRSAAFSLGVLQALNQHNVIKHIDYLSSVSGGGYIGASLTATMTKTEGAFVFGRNASSGPQESPPASDIKDTDQIGQIRNYSNYLIPLGARDVWTGAAIIVRGLVANLGFILPCILLLAAATILFNPNRLALRSADVFGVSLERIVPIESFGLTLAAIAFGLVIFLGWAVSRSRLTPEKLPEFRKNLPMWGAIYLGFIGFVFFCELQPFVIAGMFDVAGAAADGGEPSGVFVKLVASWIQNIAVILAPIAAVVTFFRQQFAEILKSASTTSSLSVKLAALMAQAGIWVAGVTLPLLIWVFYLHLSYWGITNDVAARDAAAACSPPGAIEGTIAIDGRGLSMAGELTGSLRFDGTTPCPDAATTASSSETEAAGDDGLAHTPQWLKTPATWVERLVGWVRGFTLGGRGGGGTPETAEESPSSTPAAAPDSDGGGIDPGTYAIVALYFFSSVILLALLLRTLAASPNANSLHRLYRDRLSKAFLFDPRLQPGLASVRRNDPSVDQGRDFAPLDRMKVSELSVVHAPYHLINAALNIQGSDYANRRGRNAEFFLFSPLYVGGAATGYAETKRLEDIADDLDLATAMAISGAAASSNMGSSSIRPLTPTLALLNIRLGYWLNNPRYVHGDERNLHPNALYLWSEITGRLYENSNAVYLTDGGHIENLGVYELLCRRCRLIIVVDAEGDAEMRFTSLIALQRHARIDLGVRIDLPWDPISEATRAWMAVGSRRKPVPPEGVKASSGPHIAVGRILYGGTEEGYILYIKSSLTGDESDYVRDYARRYGQFPHETTGDQFFSEEQFEVYRALGFHAMFGFLEGGDTKVVTSPKIVDDKNEADEKKVERDKPGTDDGSPEYKRWEIVKAKDSRLRRVRGLLGLT